MTKARTQAHRRASRLRRPASSKVSPRSNAAARARERGWSKSGTISANTQASTPVWVVSDDGERVLVWTSASSWKAKRIRREPNVLVAASGFGGNERGPRDRGRARVVGDLDVETLIRSKYGWQKRLLELLNKLSSRKSVPASWVTIEIVDDA